MQHALAMASGRLLVLLVSVAGCLGRQQAAARHDGPALAQESAADLRAQLAEALRVQGELRQRVADVGQEAHRGLARLRAQLRSAERAVSGAPAAAGSAQATLAQLQQAKADQAKAEAELEKERADLARRRQQLDAEAKAKTQLTSMLETGKAAQARQAAETNATLRAAARDRSKLSAELAQVRGELAAARRASVALEANATREHAAAEARLRAAHLDHLSLLNQLAELQEQGQSKLDAERKAEKKLAESSRQMEASRAEAAARDKDQERQIRGLQLRLDGARQNATDAAAEVISSQKQLDALHQATADEDRRFQAARAELAQLRSAHDADAQKQAMLQTAATQTEAASSRAREQLARATQALQEARTGQAEAARRAADLERQRDGLQASLAALRRTSAAQQASSKKELHDVMLTAADKVRKAEEKVEALQAELQKDQTALAEESGEGAKAKDTLVQETQEALKAQQRADGLASSLEAARKAADGSAQQVTSLTAAVRALRGEREQTAAALQRLTAEDGDRQAKLEALQTKSQEATARADKLAKEDQTLRAQVSDLSTERARADALAEQVESLRAGARANSSRDAALGQQLLRLRELKDHYSSEFDSEQKQADSWHSKADELDRQLQAADRTASVVAAARDAALERVRAARSEEDEYFEENSRLQQQTESLEGRLRDAWQAANQSAVDVQVLRKRVQQLRGQLARETAQRDLRAAAAQSALQVPVPTLPSVSRVPLMQGEPARPTDAAALLASVTGQGGKDKNATKAAAGAPAQTAAKPVGAGAAVPPAAPKQPSAAAQPSQAGAGKQDQQGKPAAAMRGSAAPSALQKLAAYFATPLRH